MERKELINSSISKLVDINKHILGIVSCGSFSRGDMDQYSDIDLYIFTNAINNFTDEHYNKWLHQLGDVLFIWSFKDPQEGVGKVKLVMVDGLMFDLTIVSSKRFSIVGTYLNLAIWGLDMAIPKSVCQLMENSIKRFYETIRRGYEVHVDKIGIEKILDKAVKHVERKRKSKFEFSLTSKQIENSYKCFWQSCYTASVKLIRGDFFYVVLVYDHYLKQQLIRMIEWREIISQGDHLDYFYNGYKIRNWGGDRLYNSLRNTLLSNDPIEMQSSLLNMIEIYQEYSELVCQILGFERNIRFEQFVVNFVQEATSIKHGK